MKSHLTLVTPTTKKRTVAPTRLPNAELRTREHLTEAEVGKLREAAGKNRWGHRDATMVLVAYRHGLRVSELTDLRWDQIDFETATLHVTRAKKGTPSTHPIKGDELRALRRLQREQDPKSPFVFTSERGAPFTPAAFARMIERAGEAAQLGFRLTRTCCVMPVVSPWRTRATIPGRCRPTRADFSRIEIPRCNGSCSALS